MDESVNKEKDWPGGIKPEPKYAETVCRKEKVTSWYPATWCFSNMYSYQLWIFEVLIWLVYCEIQSFFSLVTRLIFHTWWFGFKILWYGQLWKNMLTRLSLYFSHIFNSTYKIHLISIVLNDTVACFRVLLLFTNQFFK